MNDQPLAADLDEVVFDTPPSEWSVKSSVVDKVLDLDDFLAADVRLAEKQATFFIRPDLEARIQELNEELDGMTDLQGDPIDRDGSLDSSRTPRAVADQISALQREYAESRRTVLFKQMDFDDWAAFQAKWKEALAQRPPYPPEFYAALISRCAIRPKITPEQVGQLRTRLGGAAFDEMWQAAWSVNTSSGVNIPKSLLSSAVLKRSLPG